MPARPRLLDLFCGAGGAAKGYHDAGFDVLGVDINPQPNYPYEFIQADAVGFLARMVDGGTYEWKGPGLFDAVHASPPCQSFTAYRRKGQGVGDGYPDLIATVRELLGRWMWGGLPYVIENVPGAPLVDPVELCGSSFGLDVRRHRLFEGNVPLVVPACNHAAQKPGRFPGATNRAPMSRATVEVGVWRIPLETQQAAMGIDWMTLPELSEAIPARVYPPHRGAVDGPHQSKGDGGMSDDISLPDGPLAFQSWPPPITDEMVERAARVMAEGGQPQDDWVLITRALQAALMLFEGPNTEADTNE